ATLISLVISSCLYAFHGDLHSFPTRRSSDLQERDRKDQPCGQQPQRQRGGPSPGAALRQGHRNQCDPRAEHHQTGDVELPFLWRSEEHTSELQSRFDLVCRLLLEKKNKFILV